MQNNDKNQDFSLCIKKNLKNKTILKKININLSLLSDYETILKKIYEVYNENSKEVNNINLIEIYLNHPIIKNYTIYNKDDWNFYYNYNVINECISNNKLKVDYKIIKNIDNINKDIKSENDKKVIQYIMEKIPTKFYIKLFFSFFNEYKDIGELFKNYFISELIKSNLNESVKFDKLDTSVKIKSDEHKAKNTVIDGTNKYINNKYLIKTEEFLNIILLRYNKLLNDINKILNDSIEEKVEVQKDIEKSENFNQTYFSEENCHKNIFFERLDENKFSSYFKTNKDKNIFFDEKHFLKKYNKEDYYDGFEKFKDSLNNEILNNIMNNKF